MDLSSMRMRCFRRCLLSTVAPLWSPRETRSRRLLARDPAGPAGCGKADTLPAGPARSNARHAAPERVLAQAREPRTAQVVPTGDSPWRLRIPNCGSAVWLSTAVSVECASTIRLCHRSVLVTAPTPPRKQRSPATALSQMTVVAQFVRVSVSGTRTTSRSRLSPLIRT